MDDQCFIFNSFIIFKASSRIFCDFAAVFQDVGEKRERVQGHCEFCCKRKPKFIMLENKTFNSVTINIFIDIKVNLPNQNTGF